MTIGNVRLITPNEADAATLTADPPLVSTLPVENLQESSRTPARSDGLPATQIIYGNWNGPTPAAGFALIRHNLTSAGIVRLIIYEEQDQAGTVLYDSGDVLLGEDIPGWGDEDWGVFGWGGSVFDGWPVAYMNLWFTQVAGQSFEIQLSDSGNTDGYIEASRIFLGPVFEPVWNFDWRPRMGWQDDSEHIPTAGGGVRTHAVEPYRVFELNLSFLSEGERAALNEFARNYGKRGDVFFSGYPGATGTLERDHAGQVKLLETPMPIHSLVNNWSAPLRFREI